jgi:protein SCO1/2
MDNDCINYLPDIHWPEPAAYRITGNPSGFSPVDCQSVCRRAVGRIFRFIISTGVAMSSTFSSKKIYIILIFLIVLASGALIVIDLANQSRADMQVYGEIPEFEFTERSGRPFGSEQIRGKITILNFFFTSCLGPCPAMNAQVAELYRQYVTSDQVQFVSVSVDPARDSLHVLQEYADKMGVSDGRWLFIRGPLEEVYRISEKGFMLAGELPNIHSTKLILIDRQGKIRGYYDSFDEDQLRTLTIHVRELLYGD